jgi:hypothetical protein
LGALQPLGVVFTPAHILEGVSRDGNALNCRIGSDYTTTRMSRRVDQVVVNNGIMPLDDIYFALKPESRNRGRVDYDALIDGRPQQADSEGNGTFELYRIGDAVSSRNVHAAIYDALRLVKNI